MFSFFRLKLDGCHVVHGGQLQNLSEALAKTNRVRLCHIDVEEGLGTVFCLGQCIIDHLEPLFDVHGGWTVVFVQGNSFGPVAFVHHDVLGAHTTGAVEGLVLVNHGHDGAL